jgi:hypothetical protein
LIFAVATKVAGVVLAIEEEGIEGAVGDAAADVLIGEEILRQEMDRTAEGRGSDSGGWAGAAVEVNAADPLRRKEGPGVVTGSIGVEERDAVEVDVEVAIGEAAEGCGALAEPDAVLALGEGAWNHLRELAEVCDGRGVVLNIGGGYLGACRCGAEKSVERSVLRGERVGSVGFYVDLLRDVADGEGQG